MDHLYELGKRVERLLYTSVIVIVVSLLIFSLSNSIVISSATEKYKIYQELRDAIFKEKDNIDRVKNILSEYSKYKNDENNRKNAYEQTKAMINNKSEVEKQNKIRKKIGLPVSTPIVDDNYTPLTYDSYASDLNEINKITGKTSINKYINLDAANGADIAMLRSMIGNVATKNFDVYKELNSIIDTKDSTSKIIEILDKNIEVLRAGKLKIFDVETPLNVPFSIGDMKSSISLYNIEQWSMVVMPIFLVIWFGSILITRRFETHLILEKRRVMNAYPHVLNIFSILDEKHQSQKVKSLIGASLLGDEKSIKEIKSYGYFAFSLRILILIGMFILMGMPAYYGFYIVILNDSGGDNILRFAWVTFCAFINIVQLVGVVDIEAKIVSKTFILNGGNNEII
ncbi:TPA: hypothetical protein ACIR6Q_004835 [Enterobacter kobei]|uniref:hypothetical protein n=1 Tax=Enterobacter cloacae complex TaxID=354276 RepID=UPI00186630A5|nr:MULTISPECIES: hypothetical protein [Enterobacter cloacae complex]ELJ5835523.1 hypothetical protein [Enterobacter kobei]MDG9915721.1 hypothetical protein [Enterobacter kobei]MDH0041255.1 hypothetical protein [Enterobacter kobei]